MPGPQDSLSPELERLLGRFAALLRSVARRYGLSGADLDELCQDVRVRLWRALATREKIAEARASYVQRTVRSAALDLIRRRRARREQPLVEQRDSGETPIGVVPSGSGPDRALERRELAARLACAVDELAAPRDVVVRLYLAGYGREEIADLLDWTEAKTRNLLYRGLADLRARLTVLGLAPKGSA